MVHLTREAEQLMADAGQQPLPACGSAAARPPSRAALLDPLLDLEKEFLIQPQQRVRSRSAVSTRESAGPPAAGAGRGGGGDGDGDGDGTDMSAAVDKLLDQLLGCGGAGAANGGNVAATVPAAVAARSRSESAPTTIHVPTVAAAGAKAGGGEGGAAASEPQVPDNGSSWSPVLESLTQTRQAGNWVLRAVLRLESGQEAGGGGRFAAVANADGNGRGSGSDNGRSAGDKRPPVASGQQRPPLTPPPPPLQLDDVVLLPYCHSGLGLRSVLGRWEVLDRGSRRVAVEAAVPLGELLALASAAAATATPGGCLDAGSGAEWELDSESRHLRDLQIALGPLPGLFEGPNDDGDDTVYSDGCSSDTDTDIEAACNLDDGGLHDHDENGGIGTRPTHGNSSITSRSTACKARELHLGATVRITARVSSCPYLEDSGGRIGGSTESSSASLLQVRVLDVGRVIVPLHSLLQSGTNGNLAQRQQQQVEGGSKGASKAGVGDIHGGIGSVRQPPLRPATGLLLAPSRSLLLTATTGEAAGPEARMRTGAAPAAAAGGGGGVPSCGSVPCGIGAPQWARSGGMCGDLLERLLLEPGFRTPTEHESTGVRKSETAEDDEDRPTCGQLLWEGSMGWRCVVSLQPCGVYGCEVELSYVDGGGSGWDSWSSAALDHVQQLVTNAAGRSCEQVGRRLSLLCPNPLADSQLERMDIAAGALQRCVDATLELLEGALLAQQQQQLQQQQPRKQQQQNAARREVGTKPGFKDCTSGGVGTEAAMSAGATGARLQAMLQDVLQLQLQLHTAMETYLVT
ncbi:hypothetical protein Vretimale_11495 [Volvox reticuliferus]|uniref:Uncharacterized protein n=1 Tax=Volvox reticuliferus TaxID=1737510 RepID=A0A8J4LQZ4_9CHLO|nr:hypothetical protein Vretifemale_14926 [Volvox reticuliferus]GIM07350.1 hypothetical protein Vretimale_11495 [Volvox reticuliferus]